MIYLFSGTPGSGKSLHAAKNIYTGLKHKDAYYISNFPLNKKLFSNSEIVHYTYVPDDDLCPEKLLELAKHYWRYNTVKSVSQAERAIRLYIDEAQLLFNARAWNSAKNKDWTHFFSVHRHYGFEIILMTQNDFNLDKQVRGVIEYACIHRKISNIGTAGAILSKILCPFGGSLFYYITTWYPQNEKIGGQWFKYSKKYDGIYDTHALFGLTNDDGSQGSIIRIKR